MIIVIKRRWSGALLLILIPPYGDKRHRLFSDGAPAMKGSREVAISISLSTMVCECTDLRPVLFEEYIGEHGSSRGTGSSTPVPDPDEANSTLLQFS
eukprot:scaffold2884_cov141-Skeletonema_menzelii.AAC.10